MLVGTTWSKLIPEPEATPEKGNGRQVNIPFQSPSDI